MTKPDPAAARRAAYVAALREEREQLARYDNARVADVDAELARVTGEPVGRSEKPVTVPPRRTAKPKDKE